jgi:glycosyltransferase involved in cell wall biosynthesis
MRDDQKNKSGPLVTVLVPTYNRPQFLPIALGSVFNQDYDNFEIFVTNDGGVDVSDIINSFNDPRLNFIDGKENRGLPYRLNQALSQARGKYVCYLGDDDLFYPHHISTLVDILENKTDCQVAYSDLYKTYCRIEADGTRTPLSKIVEVSRDFDRMFMFYYNHSLHVSLMHRRDLWEKAGPYDENLNVLIDWFLTKRLVFYTDFYHTHEITGEFYAPVNDEQRISVKRRKDKKDYTKNVMAIRTTRPAKPWAKVEDLSIIVTADVFDQQAGNTIGNIWRHTFYPYLLYLPMPADHFNALNTDMPGLVNVPVPGGISEVQQVDRTLAVCEGDYVAIVPKGYPIGDTWVEDPLYALINSQQKINGYQLELSNEDCWAAVIRKDVLLNVRRQFPDMPIKDSLRCAGIDLKKIEADQITFQIDEFHNEAKAQIAEGNWARAAEIYECAMKYYGNTIWMKSETARCCLKSGNYKKALQYSHQVNIERPSVDTLYIEALVHKNQKNFCKAIELLEEAQNILEGKYIPWIQRYQTKSA